MVKKFEDIFIRFGATHKRDRQTDGQIDGRTDGQTPHAGNSRAMHNIARQKLRCRYAEADCRQTRSTRGLSAAAELFVLFPKSRPFIQYPLLDLSKKIKKQWGSFRPEESKFEARGAESGGRLLEEGNEPPPPTTGSGNRCISYSFLLLSKHV